MKILHVIDSVFKAGGGTSEVVPRLCEALVAAGQSVRLVTGGGDAPSNAALKACEKGVDIRFCSTKCVPYVSFLRATEQFRNEVHAGVAWADVVHVHGLWQDPSWVAIKRTRHEGKPYLMQPHGFLEPERLKISKWKKRIVGSLIERPNLNHAACVIATAESEKLGIEQYGVKAPIEIVPIGIDAVAIDAARQDRQLLEKWGLNPSKKTLLYFSRLTPIKGLDLLAQAWARLGQFHRDWQLFIAGPDDRGYATEIQDLYGRTVTDGSVAFSGPIYGAEKSILLKSVDAFVLPTRSENFGIAVQEALAAGLPVVCTKGAPWKVIADEGAGEWVEISADAICNGLRNVLSADDLTRRKMGEAGKRIVARDFGWAGIAKKLVAVYQSVNVAQ